MPVIRGITRDSAGDLLELMADLVKKGSTLPRPQFLADIAAGGEPTKLLDETGLLVSLLLKPHVDRSCRTVQEGFEAASVGSTPLLRPVSHGWLSMIRIRQKDFLSSRSSHIRRCRKGEGEVLHKGLGSGRQ